MVSINESFLRDNFYVFTAHFIDFYLDKKVIFISFTPFILSSILGVSSLIDVYWISVLWTTSIGEDEDGLRNLQARSIIVYFSFTTLYHILYEVYLVFIYFVLKSLLINLFVFLEILDIQICFYAHYMWRLIYQSLENTIWFLIKLYDYFQLLSDWNSMKIAN